MHDQSVESKRTRSGAPDAKEVQWAELQGFTPLKTKCFVPPIQARWLSRTRLTKRMNAGFKGTLTLLSAPAGFGKTTLLADWIHQEKIAVAWLSIDINDNDPQQFLAYIIAGFQRLKAGTGKAALKMLQSPQPPPVESILTTLINDVNRIPTDHALVLDDYHLIDAKPIHELISFWLEHPPERTHLMIATRADPPLALARLRGQCQLTELRGAELGFTVDEIVDLFHNRMNLSISLEDIDNLETCTEGWIAGLQLAALSLSRCEDPSVFIKAFKGEHRYIADYLTEEVLNRQSEHLRRFLLQTSILERLCSPLCDAVTRQDDGQELLNTLERENLFLIPLDDERFWYRYHHLFADLLKQRLRLSQGDLVAELHRRASQWLAQNGFKNEAVDHAFAAQDYTQAAKLIEEVAESNWDRARESRLMRWFQKLPNDHINASPSLSIFYARELFKNGYPEDAEMRLQAAESLLDSASIGDLNKDGQRGRIAAIRAYISARMGDTSRIIRFANQALKCLPQKDLMWRSVAATTLGFGYGWAGAGDLVKAHQAFSKAREISKSAGNLYYNIFAGSCLGAVLLMQAKLKEAKTLNQKVLNLAIENGIEQTGIVGSLYGNVGMILCEWNQLDEGIRQIKKGVELSELGRDPVIQASCQVSLLKAYIYRKDYAGAFKLMAQINECAGNFMLPPWITNTISAFNVFIWLATGNLNAALQWARERKLSIDDEIDNLRVLEYLALAHMLIVQKQLDDADGLLQRLIKTAKAGDQVYIVIEMLLWRASVFKAKGEYQAALGALNKALALAESGGLLMIFVSKGNPVAELLAELIEAKKKDRDNTRTGFSLAYAKKLLTVFKADTQVKITGLMDPLSSRELEVLHLIAAGLSNREIAEKLFISLNTVKTHTKNINSKLNVNSRTRAVARAKALNLL